MRSALIVLVVTLSLILILFVIPELLRRLALLNAYRQQELNTALGEFGALLRAAANRLRPYRELEAPLFHDRYEPARDNLQEVVEQYRSVATRLAALGMDQLGEGVWAFPYFLEQPREIVYIPRDFLQLLQLQRQIDGLRDALTEAETYIAEVEKTPLQLQREATHLAEQRLPGLAETLEQERNLGLATLGELPDQLAQLQSEASELAQQLRADPPPDLAAMDSLAQALVPLQETTNRLDTSVKALRDRRQSLDDRLTELDDARTTIRTTAGEEVLRDGLQPLLTYADGLIENARTLRQKTQFEEATALTDEAKAVMNLAQHLAAAAERVRELQDVAEISLQAPDIEVLSRRLFSAFRAAYALIDAETADEEAVELPAELADAENRHEALQALQLRVVRLSDEARRLHETHDQTVEELEKQASREATALGEAWEALQQKVKLPSQDPVARHYHNLLHQRTQAARNPLQLQSFVDESQAFTAELTEATTALERGLQRVEALRAELPKLLEEAETEADNWHALQPYLREMKEATANIWQITASDISLAQIRATLDEIDFLEEQARAAYTALMGERQRLALWERRIAEARQAVDSLRGTWEGGELRRLGKQVDADLTAARRAETVEAARNLLQRALALLEDETPPSGEA